MEAPESWMLDAFLVCDATYESALGALKIDRAKMRRTPSLVRQARREFLVSEDNRFSYGDQRRGTFSML
jgi:hypothetical protein